VADQNNVIAETLRRTFWAVRHLRIEPRKKAIGGRGAHAVCLVIFSLCLAVGGWRWGVSGVVEDVLWRLWKAGSAVGMTFFCWP